MLTCPVCGTPAVPGGRFCFHCGSPLGQVPEVEAERRVVTVLFGDLSDFTSWAEDLDPEQVGTVTDRVLAGLAQVVAEVGGHVDKLTGDGIMAVFGAPTSHEDDPERAVRAAVSMQAAIKRLVEAEDGGGRRLGLRVGLNTGEVLAGVQASLAYTVVGDTVNTAARLSDAAGVGAIVAGRETALATVHTASWRALPPLRLKGKRDLVPAYELTSLHALAAPRLGLGEAAPFTGRGRELREIVGIFADVTETGRPASVLVTGDAGIGKTRLVQELARIAGDAPGARVLWGRCTPYGEGRDLAPILQMVRTACGITDDDPLEVARNRVRRAVSRLDHPAHAQVVTSRTLGEHLLELLGLGEDSSTSPRTEPVNASPVRRERLGLTMVAEFFRGLAAEAPLLLCLDDLHWAGPDLLEAVVSVGTALVGPVMLVGLARPEADDRGDWSAGLPGPHRITLQPLDDGAADDLLAGYLEGAELTVDQRRTLLDRAEGNPFFLAELLNLLVDRGLLRRSGGTWVLEGPLPEDVLPAGVQAVLSARIDTLEPPTRAVLRDAAVLGTQFSPAALCALGHDPQLVGAALAELTSRGITHPVPEPHGWHAFSHTLVRDVAYAGLPKGERARRHASAAAWAATAGLVEADRLVAYQSEQAIHLAEEMSLPLRDAAWEARPLGFESLARLGERALARDDNVGAATLLGRSLSLADAEQTALPVRLAYAEALAGLRRLTEAEEALAPALASDEPRWSARAHLVLGDVRRKQGRDSEARAELVSALTSGSEAGHDRTVGEALRHLGLLDYRSGRLGDAETSFRQALELARRSGDRRGEGWALQHLAWSATTRGDYPLADASLLSAAEVFAALEDTGGLAWCAGTEGLVRLLQGRLQEARGLAQALLPVTEAMGDVWSEAACLTIDAWAAAELGAVGDALQEAARALELFAATEDSWGLALAQVAAGSAARAAGDVQAAQAAFRDAAALAASEGHRLIELLAMVTLGMFQLVLEDVEGAAASSARATVLAEGLDVEEHAAAGAQALAGMVARAQGDPHAARTILGQVVASTEESTLLFPRRLALAHLAGTLLALGEESEAVVAAHRAVAASGEDVRSTIVALRVLARAQAGSGDTAAAHETVRRALEAATSTEHTGELEATRALAEQLRADHPIP